MYVAIKKKLDPTFLLTPQTHGVGNSLAVGSYHHRDQAHCLLLQYQGAGSRSWSYSAYKVEGSGLTLPPCQGYKGQESKVFPKRKGYLSAFLRKLSLYSSALCPCMANGY